MSAQTRRASAWIAGAVFSAVIVVAVTAIAQRGGQHSVQHVAAFDASTYQLGVDGGYLKADATANRANALAASPGGCDGGFFRSMTASGIVTCAASASIDAAGLAPAFDANNFAPLSTTLDAGAFAPISTTLDAAAFAQASTTLDAGAFAPISTTLDAAGFAKLGQDASFVTVTASHLAATTAAITNLTGTSSLAAAASANGSNCSANQCAGGVDQSWAAESCIAPLLLSGGTMAGQIVATGVATPIVLGSGAAGVDYCISANGETNDPTGGICWDEDLGQWAIHNGETLLFWSAAAGAAGFYTSFSPYGQQSVYYSNTGVDVNGPYTQFIRYRGTGFGSGAAVQDGDSLGWIVFNGGDTGSSIDQAAIIAAYVDGTPSSGTDMPGRVVISTTPNSSATPREIFRASAAGDLHAVSGGTYNACSVATADGDFCAEDALQAVGTLDVGGAATLASTLAVTGGAATITGDVIRTDAKGATTKIVHATQSLTFAADPGDATKVTSGLIPAAATLKGISTRVVTAGTNCSSIDIGDGTDPDRFGNDEAITDAALTTNADATADPTGWLTTAREVTVTSNTANCFNLVIAVTAHYETISAATAD